MTRLLSIALFLTPLAAPAVAGDPPKKDEIEVQVVAILASENHNKVDDRLKEFATHVQSKNEKLTGFKVGRTSTEKLDLGQTKKFDLVDGQGVEVTVNKERNEKGRVTLTIKPPGLDQITYECTCGKFFAMATQHYVGKDKDRQQLFIAIVAKPCVAKSK
jgi:hypothetical protein